MKALERRVLAADIDRAMSDTAIFQVLDEVRRKETLSDSALPLMTRLIVCSYEGPLTRGCEERRRAVRACVTALLPLRRAASKLVFERALSRQ